jgi:hypothetical protein
LLLTSVWNRKDHLFTSILGFNKDKFLPSKTLWLISDYALFIFVNSSKWLDLLANLLNDHREIGPHSGLVSVLADQISVYAWAQIDKHPHGVREPAELQCQFKTCHAIRTTKLKFINGQGNVIQNSANYHRGEAVFDCSRCGSRSRCKGCLPDVMFPEDLPVRSGWLDMARVAHWRINEARA